MRYLHVPACNVDQCTDDTITTCDVEDCSQPSERTCYNYEWVNYDVSESMPFNETCAGACLCTFEISMNDFYLLYLSTPGPDNPFPDSESFQNDCAIMNLTSGEVTTTSCHAQYSYICLSASRQGKRG